MFELNFFMIQLMDRCIQCVLYLLLERMTNPHTGIFAVAVFTPEVSHFHTCELTVGKRKLVIQREKKLWSNDSKPSQL